jgi:hypothetical protein
MIRLLANSLIIMDTYDLEIPLITLDKWQKTPPHDKKFLIKKNEGIMSSLGKKKKNMILVVLWGKK